jgi:hypothetical protein
MKKLAIIIVVLGLIGAVAPAVFPKIQADAIQPIPAIKIIAPNGGEQWAQGSSQTIRWVPQSSITNLRIGFTGGCPAASPACPSAFNVIADNVPDTGAYVWNIPSQLPLGQYVVFMDDIGGSGISGRSATQFSIVSATTNTIRIGANVLMNGTVYYVAPPIIFGPAPGPGMPQPQPTLSPYTSAAVFLSYGFNSWPGVLTISNAEAALQISGFMPYADGTLVNDNGTVYVISGNTKHGIPSANAFTALGYQWSSVISGSVSFMSDGGIVSSANAEHLPGTLVNFNGTIYYVGGYASVLPYGIPSMSVFNSWGFKLSNVVQANSFDINLISSTTIISAWQQGMLVPVPNQPAPA